MWQLQLLLEIQVGGFGPVTCSTSIDSVGRRTDERKRSFYTYKETVDVLPLTHIDDVLGASECGKDSKDLNTFLVTQIEMKRLKFKEATEENKKGKCFKMHVGEKKDECPYIIVVKAKLSPI